ncbi:MAG: TonB family protein [PVC group bacterium]
MVIWNSIIIPGWIKKHPFVSFFLLSLLVHAIVITLTGGWGRLTGGGARELIECDYRELPESLAEEDQGLSGPVLPEPALEESAEPEGEKTEPPLPEKAPARPAAAVVLLPDSNPAETGNGESARARALEAYVAYLQDIIDFQIEYPERASREAREGEVTVVFILNRKGELLALGIPRDGASPFHPFNREALRAVQCAARYFDSFPEPLDDEEITFLLPIIFSLH